MFADLSASASVSAGECEQLCSLLDDLREEFDSRSVLYWMSNSKMATQRLRFS